MTILSEENVQNIYTGSQTLSASSKVNSDQSSQLVKSTLVVLTFVGAVVAGASIWLAYASDLNWLFPMLSIGAYLVSGGLVMAMLKTHPYRQFGAANAITAIRAGITCLIAGALFQAEWLLETQMLPVLLAAAAIALCLDGIDGYVARRSAMNSDFGARYDMEVDAALILCLSILAFLFEKAGWWVMIIGSMRYLFVAAQYLDTRLRIELTPSLRRQTICVLQIVALGIILLPVVEAPISTVIAAVSLMTLSYSFGLDVTNLLRRGRHLSARSKSG
ncbi:CDP-alcohol phosphatidyltransferase family protein [Phyllobacterium sp. K27]